MQKKKKSKFCLLLVYTNLHCMFVDVKNLHEQLHSVHSEKNLKNVLHTANCKLLFELLDLADLHQEALELVS